MRAQNSEALRRGLIALVFIVAVFGPAIVYTQAPTVPPATLLTAMADVDTLKREPTLAAVETSIGEPEAIRMFVGRSTIVRIGSTIQRVSLTSSDVADAVVTSATELLLNGKSPGTISMFVWDRSGSLRRYQITVQRDIDKLAEQLKQLFPNESIQVRGNGKTAVLSGMVSSKDIAEKAVNLAGGFVEKKEEVVSLLQIRDGGPSNQVLLRVRFAEVSRSAMTELGASYYTDGYKDTLGRVTTQQFAAPFFDKGGAMVGEHQVFSDYLNLFLFDFKNQLGAVIKALQQRGLFQSLAEPNLVAESGKEASFLAGGEFPIPVAQGSGGAVAITVQFKEFGIRLNFTPVVNGNRIHLKVRPEVSSLDFNNAIVLNGFRIPALSTRRTETELELENGQTFAISGLLNNTMSSTLRKIPGIGDIPILGLLFQSKAAQKDRTELVVVITPELLPVRSQGVTPNLPQMTEPFMPPVSEDKVVPSPPPAFVADGAAPVFSPTAANAVVPPPAAAPSLTQEERKAQEKARKDEAKRLEAEQKARNEETKHLAREAEKQAEMLRRKEKAEAELKERQAREQLKRESEAAGLAAEIARKQAEEAKQKAERDKKNEKSIAEAQARLKAAEAAYQAELQKGESR